MLCGGATKLCRASGGMDAFSEVLRGVRLKDAGGFTIVPSGERAASTFREGESSDFHGTQMTRIKRTAGSSARLAARGAGEKTKTVRIRKALCHAGLLIPTGLVFSPAWLRQAAGRPVRVGTVNPVSVIRTIRVIRVPLIGDLLSS